MSGQQALKRGRERNLNRGFEERPNFNSAWHAIDNILQLLFDLIRQYCSARRDLRLGDVDKLAPLRFGSIPKYSCCGL